VHAARSKNAHPTVNGKPILIGCAPMMEPLSNPQLRRFKAAAQLLEPMLKVGKAGLSDGFVRSVDEA